MKAIVVHAAKDLRIETREVAEPGAGEVLVRMAMGGICGSDLHYYNHGGFGAVRLREPMVLGHEVSGFVEAVGAGVDGLEVGQLVAVSPSRPCGACDMCLRGQPNHCLSMRFYGSAMPFPHVQGAFSESLVVDARQCAPADELSSGHAAVAEPLAVCLHAAGLAGDMLGKRVLVTGCGPIGLLCVLVARAAGAAEIMATDIEQFPLEKALAVGADVAVNVSDGVAGLERYAAGKGTVDVHFECSGVAAAVASAVPVVRPGATIVQVGLGGDMTLPMQAITAKELRLRGSFRFHDEFFVAVEMMRRGRIDVSPLITHEFGMDDAVEAFETASDRTRAIKIQIRLS
ncbi:MAG: L-idonate 5-dehydrogenase [Planctomycetota bacterium]